MHDMHVDLTNCDREPIHKLGRVQSYGALIGIGEDWRVLHASENLQSILGVSFHSALGRPAAELIDPAALRRIRDSMGAVESSDNAVRLFGVTIRTDLGPFDVSIHQLDRLLLIEFEPKGRAVELDVMSEVHPLIRRIRFRDRFEKLASDAAAGLRALSRFDSVMVYRFSPDGSGQVIAENRADGHHKYLGQHFPATDIPGQARALYKRSLLRLIADVSDKGARIFSEAGTDDEPLDLSMAVTRAVSPIHLEYLANMGVGASMSVSIMKDGELWGLFACHHDEPLYIDYERRTAVEMFGHMFSYELGRQEESLRYKAEDDVLRLQSRLMTRITETPDIASTILTLSPQVAEVIPHDGMAFCWDGDVTFRGMCPPESDIKALAEILGARQASQGQIAAVDCLQDLMPGAAAYTDRCAGVLALPIGSRSRDFVMFFRREREVVMDWAGNPEKPVTVGPNGIRLTPRQSFAAWRDTVVGHAAPWTIHSRHAAEKLRTLMLEAVLTVAEAQTLERKRAAEQQQLLISELNHRVRNILNLMRGLVAQSKSGATSVGEFTASLDGRIHALAKAHDQLTAENWEPASLRQLIQTEFQAFADGKIERVTITGPDAMILPTAYTTLALVLHEMATNSIKYGALCDQAGRIEIGMSYDQSGALTITWRERGGPPVAPPRRRGFGTTIIERSIPHELRGLASIDYKVSGVEARFVIPAALTTRVDLPDAPAHTAQPDASKPAGPDAAVTGDGLVLEDSLIIALDAADMLEDLGASSVQICSSVGEALKILESRRFDFALLDVNLGSEQSVPVAEKLARIGTPFVLATGYGEASALVDSYPPCVIVQKPFSPETLANAFQRSVSDSQRPD